ncbi:MAG: bifunctional precorrin-2 dehydrogenase/sirohydrochlorin ferrochelatase [Treponemataceae bacterium]
MRYFPISIDTKNKRVAVLGGGKIAGRKIKTLLNSELCFDVYAEEFDSSVQKEYENYTDRIVLIQCHIDENFEFENYDFCLLATNDKKLNHYLSIKAKTGGLLVLDTSNLENCDFTLNKLVLKNAIAIGVSTNGKSPTVAKLVGKEIENLVDKYNDEELEKIFETRKTLKEKNCKNIGEIIEKMWASMPNNLDA